MSRPSKRSRSRKSATRKSASRTRKRGPASKLASILRNPLVRFFIVAGLIASFIGLLIGGMILFQYERAAASYDISAVGRMPQESVVLDATGDHIGYLHGEDIGTPVPLDQISPYFLNALIAREDGRFYRHHGVDHFGLVRAWLRNARENRTVQGASTITMQLTRMTYGLTGKTIQRKLLEMAIARRIESHYTKDEILYHYVSRVFLGTGMNGIEQAAQGYFGKPAADLTLPEAAMTAGVIRAPNGFSPFRNYDAALREMRSTLWRMEDEGYITKKEAKSMESAKPVVLDQSLWMEMLRKHSKVSEQTYLLKMVGDQVDELVPSLAGVGGLTIRTTFDSRLQTAAERALVKHLDEIEAQADYPHPKAAQHQSGDPGYLQAATVLLENYTGAMRVMVGGRDFSESAFNRATQAQRPMGSIFKPLVYGAAFERGLFPGQWISDAAIGPHEISWAKDEWNPGNSDGTFGGMLPVSQGLIRSRNTMTIRVGEWAGINNVLAMMEHAGLGDRREMEPSPTVYIGTTGANVKDVTSAFSVFATGGIRHQPYFIENIEDRDGTALYAHESANYRVLSPGAAWLTSNILKQVMQPGGTAASIRKMGFTAPAGGKTGTTNAFFDAWFVGYTSRLSGGVWLGLDQPETIMKGAYGGRIAMPIWEEIMSEAEAIGYEFTDFAAPEEVISMELCHQSGLLAGEACRRSETVYVEGVPHDLIPRKFCKEH